MAAQRLDLLDPFEVAQLGGVEFTAEGVVEGFLAGIHRSPFRGFSVEFAEHRPYQLGDELRYVDWRMLARSDKLFVKQYEEETNLRSMIVLDASASMNWSGADGRLSKLDYGKRLAAALGFILLGQHDATGFIGFDETVTAVVPARAAETVVKTFFASASMMVTLLAFRLAANASFPSGVNLTLWEPLSAGIVARILSEEGSRTTTLADFMLVTQISAAQPLAAETAPSVTTPKKIPAFRITENLILTSMFRRRRSLAPYLSISLRMGVGSPTRLVAVS